jgi:hypothetical protein
MQRWLPGHRPSSHLHRNGARTSSKALGGSGSLAQVLEELTVGGSVTIGAHVSDSIAASSLSTGGIIQNLGVCGGILGRDIGATGEGVLWMEDGETET